MTENRLKHLNPIQREARINGWITRYTIFGEGCVRIANLYGHSTTEVYNTLKRRGVQIRPRKCSERPPIAWNGRTYYYLTSKRCYGASNGERKTYLARDIWEHYCGPIPEGHEIRHLDRDPSNNDLSNLVCVTRSEGSAMHTYRREDNLGPRYCLYCGEKLERKRSETYKSNAGLEPFIQYARRRYCGLECAGRDQKGKPRGWSPDNPIEPEQYPIKYCLTCGEQLRPRVQQGGKMDGFVEPMSAFKKRKTCNFECGSAYRKTQPRRRARAAE